MMIRTSMIAALALSASMLGALFSGGHANETSEIRSLIVKIQQEPIAAKREAYSEALVDTFQKLYESKTLGQQVDRRTIRDLTNLLGDYDDDIRGNAAAALGFIGPRAHSAVPSLKRALSRIVGKWNWLAKTEAVVVRATADSEGPIRVALERITGRPRDTFPPFIHSEYQKLR